MTRELLEQYLDICAEIRELQKEHVVSDTVSASSSEFPYNQYTVTVRGIANGAQDSKLKNLLRQKEEIETFVETAENPANRLMLEYRILQGLSWKTVTAKMGWRYTEDGLRKRYSRLF